MNGLYVTHISLALLLCANGLIAAPIYDCLGQDEKKVFQATACSNDRMYSLADTHSSDVYRRKVAFRETRDAERKLAEAARLEIVSKAAAISAGLLPVPSAMPTETETLIEAKRLAAERDALEYLRLCMAGDKDCDVGTLAFALQGSRMGPVEALLGEGREQKLGIEHYFY